MKQTNVVSMVEGLTEKGASQIEESYDDSSAAVWQAESLAALDAYTLKSMFTTEEWVFILCDLLANELSTAYPQVVKRTVVDGKQAYVPAHDHWIQSVLDDPCDLLDSAGFWYKACVEYTLMGNWISWYMRASRKFEIIPAEGVQINFNEFGTVTAYQWYPDDPTRMMKAQCMTFSPDDIIHVRRPNPMSRLWGLSPFIPGRKSILFMRYSSDYINAFYSKGAAPGVVLETESSSDIAALKRFQAMFEQTYMGRRNHRRPLVLPKGVKANKLDFSLVDQDFIEVIKNRREDVINLLHIPKHALSLQEAGSLGSEEHKEALRYMWKSTIRPILRRFEKALTKFFRPQLGPDHEIMFDTSEVDVLTGEPKLKAETANIMRTTMTINEIRQTVWELPPLPGGDTLATSTGSPQATSAQATPHASQSANSDSQRPAPPTDAGQSFDKAIEHDSIDPGWFERTSSHIDAQLKAIGDEETAKQESMGTLATDTLLDLLQAAMPVVTRYLKRYGTEKAIPAQARLRADIKAAMDELGPDYADNYEEELRSTVDLGIQSQLDLVFNAEAKAAIEAITDQTARARPRMLKARGLDSFAHISKTSTDLIIDDIAKGIEAGLPVNEIARGLADHYGELTPARARTIARTEVLTAVSLGQNATVQAALDVIPDAKKVWITGLDERVRDTHKALHGKVVDANDTWKSPSGSEFKYPRDPRADNPAEVINCRCTMALVLPEQG